MSASPGTKGPAGALSGRHVREQRAQPLCHRRVREGGVAKLRIRQVCQHRSLHYGHDLTGLGANHRKAEYAVVAPDKSLHEALCFVRRLRPQDSARRQLRDACSDALPLRFALAQFCSNRF
jgi:hypothetical protein